MKNEKKFIKYVKYIIVDTSHCSTCSSCPLRGANMNKRCWNAMDSSNFISSFEGIFSEEEVSEAVARFLIETDLNDNDANMSNCFKFLITLFYFSKARILKKVVKQFNGGEIGNADCYLMHSKWNEIKTAILSGNKNREKLDIS